MQALWWWRQSGQSVTLAGQRIKCANEMSTVLSWESSSSVGSTLFHSAQWVSKLYKRLDIRLLMYKVAVTELKS